MQKTLRIGNRRSIRRCYHLVKQSNLLSIPQARLLRARPGEQKRRTCAPLISASDSDHASPNYSLTGLLCVLTGTGKVLLAGILVTRWENYPHPNHKHKADKRDCCFPCHSKNLPVNVLLPVSRSAMSEVLRECYRCVKSPSWAAESGKREGRPPDNSSWTPLPCKVVPGGPNGKTAGFEPATERLRRARPCAPGTPLPRE